MVNITYKYLKFCDGIKITWLRRFISEQNYLHSKLFESTHSRLSKLPILQPKLFAKNR